MFYGHFTHAYFFQLHVYIGVKKNMFILVPPVNPYPGTMNFTISLGGCLDIIIKHLSFLNMCERRGDDVWKFSHFWAYLVPIMRLRDGMVIYVIDTCGFRLQLFLDCVMNSLKLAGWLFFFYFLLTIKNQTFI